MFDGATLKDWEGNPEFWRMEDDAIVPPAQGRGGFPGMKGYQFDFDFAGRYTGQLYEQATPRGIIAWRGQAVRAEQGKKLRLLSTLGHPDELKGYVKVNEWNQVHIIARGNTLMHIPGCDRVSN